MEDLAKVPNVGIRNVIEPNLTVLTSQEGYKPESDGYFYYAENADDIFAIKQEFSISDLNDSMEMFEKINYYEEEECNDYLYSILYLMNNEFGITVFVFGSVAESAGIILYDDDED